MLDDRFAGRDATVLHLVVLAVALDINDVRYVFSFEIFTVLAVVISAYDHCSFFTQGVVSLV